MVTPEKRILFAVDFIGGYCCDSMDKFEWVPHDEGYRGERNPILVKNLTSENGYEFTAPGFTHYYFFEYESNARSFLNGALMARKHLCEKIGHNGDLV